MASVEVIGDSARGADYAAVRLVVDGDRIVDADAPGLARPLAGLTLLEAAAVPGETLAADALRELARRLELAGIEVEWADPAEIAGRDRFHVHDPWGNRLELLAPA